MKHDVINELYPKTAFAMKALATAIQEEIEDAGERRAASREVLSTMAEGLARVINGKELAFVYGNLEHDEALDAIHMLSDAIAITALGERRVEVSNEANKR